MTTFDNYSATYTSLFCEENIWKLIESFKTNSQAVATDVLFIINSMSSVALFNQKRSINNLPAVWDYHVILSGIYKHKNCIFDFDSRGDFPETTTGYFNNTFPSHRHLPQQYQPLIRSIPADYFFNHFYSDRSHMKGVIPENKFPDYPIINSENKTGEILDLNTCRNLDSFIPNSRLMTPVEYFTLKQEV